MLNRTEKYGIYNMFCSGINRIINWRGISRTEQVTRSVEMTDAYKILKNFKGATTWKTYV